MALIDTYQLVHNYTLLGKKMLNVYQAVRQNSGETAQTVTDSFVATCINDIRLLQSTEVANIDVITFNLGDATDFHTQDLAGLPGLRGGLDSPTFVCAGIRFPSLNRLVRSGQKRYAGVFETDYTAGVIIASTITLLENIGDVLLSDWFTTPAPHHAANFIVVKRICDETDPVSGKCLKYRLPESDGELVFYQPISRLVKADITSQVSRKVF